MKNIGLGLFFLAAVVMNASGSFAQNNQPSAKLVKLLSEMAFVHVPKQTQDGKGKKITINKSDPKSIFIPPADAREVIKVGYNSGRAQNCGVDAYQVANYQAMMRAQRAKKKWSTSQLVFINKLHFVTVMLKTGQVELSADGIKQKSTAEINKSIAKGSKKKACSKKELDQLKKDIEAYVFSIDKSLKKS